MNRAPKFRHRRAAAAIGLVAVVAVAASLVVMNVRDSRPAPTPARAACEASLPVLQRMWNGYYPGRSGDILAAEQPDDLFGTRHSTPYYYTQHVPMVLYGPGYIRSGVQVSRAVTMADVAPTFADLLHFDGLGQVDGNPLVEALKPDAERNGIPKLIFTLVWDGGGWDGLNYWSKAWPNLKKLMSEGTNFTNATVGSSPSITPSIHSTLGTGDFPDKTGISDIQIRVHGDITDGWEGSSPKYLEEPTLADLYDRANGNQPLVGLLARDRWHLGMIGHGSYFGGGDKDIAVLDSLGALKFRTNHHFYSMPANFDDPAELERDITTVDQRDGKADHEWLGNPMLTTDGRVRYTPAWDIYQSQRVIALLKMYGFGSDSMPDLFFTNYKSVDLAGHTWLMTSPEEQQDMAAQDAEIPVLLHALNKLVGRDNYVMLFTADHGMQPPTSVTDGWSINTREMTDDLEKHFDHVTPDTPLVQANRGYQFFLRKGELKKNHITANDVAQWIRDYQVQDNLTGTNKIPSSYKGSPEDHLYQIAETPKHLKVALSCAERKRGSPSASPTPSG